MAATIRSPGPWPPPADDRPPDRAQAVHHARYESAFQELNRCVSNLTDGWSQEDALTEAQRAGLAERDPAADVEGHDAAAKVMILSGLVFGRQLRRQ
jgi:uncharacterized protein YecT (DUF1311 family)